MRICVDDCRVDSVAWSETLGLVLMTNKIVISCGEWVRIVHVLDNGKRGHLKLGDEVEVFDDGVGPLVDLVIDIEDHSI